MLYEYLSSVSNLWIKVLYYIDKDYSKYDDSEDKHHSINLYENYLFDKLTFDNIVSMYPNVKSKACLEILLVIHNIYLLVELFIKYESNLYTFFRLSNVVKVDNNIDVNFYTDYFKLKNIKKDIDEEIDGFTLQHPKIQELMDIFYSAKTTIFEQEFSKFIESNNK